MNAIKMNVNIEITVDEDWIEFLTQYSDIFGFGYCGYWMCGLERDNKLGWLCFEHNEEMSANEVSELPEYRSIVRDWRAGKPLPENWHRLDKDAAIRAYKAGAERYGVDWYENGDAVTYDVAIQMALLGDVVYG